MKKIIWFTFWGLMMSSFTDTEPVMYGNHLQQLVFKDVNKVLERFSKQYELVVNGSGGAFCEDIEQIMVSLHIQKYVDVKEARTIYVDIIESIVNQLNQNKELRPYLRDYPTTDAPLQLRISFVDKRTHYPPKEYVYYLRKNNVDALIFDNYENNKLETIHEEPFKESLQIIYQEKIRKS